MGFLKDLVVFFYLYFESFVETFLPFMLRKKYPLAGKNVLVTGAANGIGRQIALEVAARKGNLILIDVNEQQLKDVAEEIKGKGRKVCHIQVVDVSKRDEIAKAAAQIKSAVGHVDVLINNAGVAVMRQLMEQSDDDIERTIQINLLAHFWTIRAFLPQMKARQTGHIVTIASAAGYLPANNLTSYCASKFGAVGFHLALRTEIEYSGFGDKIGMTLVCPSFVKTRMTDDLDTKRYDRWMPQVMPDELAKSVVDGVEYRKETVVIPKSIYLVIANLAVQPVKATLQMLKLIPLDGALRQSTDVDTLKFVPTKS